MKRLRSKREAKEAAEERAKKTGEELIKEVEEEEAAKQRKKDAAKEKKESKKRKDAPKFEGESEPTKGEEDNPEGDKPKKEESSKEEPPKEESKGDEENPGPIKDEEPAEPWMEVIKKSAKPRQNTSKAAEEARARTYPRPMCEANAQGTYVYDPRHVPTRELIASGKWSVVEKTRDIPPTRNPMRLKEIPHKAIHEYGI